MVANTPWRIGRHPALLGHAEGSLSAQQVALAGWPDGRWPVLQAALQQERTAGVAGREEEAPRGHVLATLTPTVTLLLLVAHLGACLR